LEQLAKAAFIDIQHSFSAEIIDWRSIAKQQVELFENDSIQAKMDDGISQDKPCKEPVAERPDKKLRSNCEFLMKVDKNFNHLLEGVYLIDRKEPRVDGLGVLASENQYRPTSYSIDSRDYVNYTKNCRGWEWRELERWQETPQTQWQPPGVWRQPPRLEPTLCSNTFYVERLRNKLDMRLNTWVGIPRFAQLYPKTPPADSQDILIFGGELKTFLHTVMPKDFRFLVFDNQTGEVLYHSDEWLSKIDNIFADTDNDYHLRNLIKSHNPQSVAFETRYKGKDAVFQIGAIAQNVPWTLVVMYDKSPYRLLNLLSAFSSWSLSFCYLLLGYLLWRVLPNRYQLQLTKLIWFSPDRTPLYRLLNLLLFVNLLFAVGAFWGSIELLWSCFGVVFILIAFYLGIGRRFHAELPVSKYSAHPLRSYSLFILLLLLNLTAIPSAIFSNQTSEYLLYRQAQLQQQYLQSMAKHKQKQMVKYIDQFFDAEIFQGVTKNAVLKNTRVNCYPKALFDLDYLPYCSAGHDITSGGTAESLDPTTTALFSKVLPGQIFFGRLPWYWARLQLPLFSEIWVLQQTENQRELHMPAKPAQLISHLIRSAPFITQVCTGFIVCIALIMLLLLIRYWLCRRMMGLDRVENFRINPEPTHSPSYKTYSALVKILYPHQNNSGKAVYLQLVRPSEATEKLITSQRWGAGSSGEGQPNCMISGLTPLNVCDLRLPVQSEHLVSQTPTQLPTLLLTGFEPLFWRKSLRLEVLSKL
ncbi:MAG: hypothetical protein KKE30_06660, partial [Gammaproteobacteria bacterium]|nr:hypothetical protein [Gammaproteobacteria bacterium]